MSTFATRPDFAAVVYPDHDEQLAGDTLTSLTINHEWRSILIVAIDRHLSWLQQNAADDELYTNWNTVLDILNDLYDA